MKNNHFLFLLVTLLFFSCSEESKEKSEKPVPKAEENQTVEQMAKRHLESQLSIPATEKYSYHIYKAHLDEDEKIDAIITLNRVDFALEEAMRCSQEQANELVRLLQHALENRMNVVVHCYAGVCRSGAVCELGVMMGFEDTGRFRSPNLCVKHRMMKALGWTYDPDEKPNLDDWRTFKSVD